MKPQISSDFSPENMQEEVRFPEKKYSKKVINNSRTWIAELQTLKQGAQM